MWRCSQLWICSDHVTAMTAVNRTTLHFVVDHCLYTKYGPFTISSAVARIVALKCRLLKLGRVTHLMNWHQWHLRLLPCHGSGSSRCQVPLRQAASGAQRRRQLPSSGESLLDAHVLSVSRVLTLLRLLQTSTQSINYNCTGKVTGKMDN